MSQCKIGTAPVSWGIWFTEDDKQMSWERCLDEMAIAGYTGMELGPWGYMPNKANKLKEELKKRDIQLVSTTLMDDLTCTKNTNKMIEQLDEMASIQVQFEEAKYVVLIDACYTDLFTGKQIRKKDLTEREKDIFYHNIKKINNHAKTKYDLEVVYHPHSQTHIETEEQIEEFLERTNINLCFDTGHHAYMGADVINFIKQHHNRISYIHLKNCDLSVLEATQQNNWSLAKAVQEGVMVEPAKGIVDMNKLVQILKKINFDGWIIVEQDMYPAPFEKPLPIAKRTRNYLREIGMG
ncbi:sugar phosphate isomerase/epimerase family protein [Pseudogracilibacillus auburnensis]|uniref:2-keto-myo-inositol dehydratase n=1 Tax=Pseudogracilibacillus auburnensis TaxID=1494959 RepID=A0A2V3W333_9BACI|nr:sugar phosphate isomerase/epimerase [Pseudogracilibacillus auburnensis]PXW86665.1 2-keto-myo-inositol dehydratase [Pseudogracilibacillus auburnensis]